MRRTAINIKTKMLLSLAMASAMLVAMPTREEVDKAASLVQDIMKPEREALEAGKKTRAEVAEAALDLAENKADSEAEMLLLVKGAFNLYVHDGAFDKAADSMKTLKYLIPDMPPQVVANIIESSFGDVSNTNDVRLCGLLDEAKACVRCQNELEAARAESAKDPKNGALHLKTAELYAFLGPWPMALDEFTKGDDRRAAAMAEAERGGGTNFAAKAKEIADFWWDYPAQKSRELQRAFRLHAAEIYKDLIMAKGVSGLAGMQAERRIEDSKAYGTLFFQKGDWFDRRARTVKLHLAAGVDLELIKCPAGEFTMGYECWKQFGSPLNREARKTHQVILTKDFMLGKFPVTYAQWHVVMGEGKNQAAELMDAPVGNITVPEMEAFCEKLTDKFKERFGRNVFRLPTEAEWEYASKGGKNLKGVLGSDCPPFSSSKEIIDYKAKFVKLGYIGEDHKCVSNAGEPFYMWKTLSVGKFDANEWGFKDLIGNAMEVTADMVLDSDIPELKIRLGDHLRTWNGRQHYASVEIDPLRKDERHVVRGGFSGERGMEIFGPSNKVTVDRNCRLPTLGFRVCLGDKLGDWNNAEPSSKAR